MRVRCIGRAVASSRMSGVIRRRRSRAAVVFEGWVSRSRAQEAGVAELWEFRVPSALHFCEGVRGLPGSLVRCVLPLWAVVNLES
jgi:hypothetical protein